MSVNDRLMKALEEYGGKTLNERIYHFLGSLGFTNSLSDRLAKYESGRYREPYEVDDGEGGAMYVTPPERFGVLAS